MTLRSVLSLLVVGLIAVIIAAVTIGLYVFSDPEPPSEPGNYVLLGDDTCELRIVRAEATQNVTLRPSSCTPLTKGLGLSDGLTAVTLECGVLTFGPPAIPTDFGAFSCVECSVGAHRSGACPLAGLDSASLLRWEHVD